MSDRFNFFPARVSIVDSEGKPTQSAVKAFNKVAQLLGGELGILPTSLIVKLFGENAFGILYLDASNKAVTTSALTNGQVLIGSTGAAPVPATLSGTADRLTITNGAGSVTLDIATTYIGQDTITTVGTVTSGSWNADAIAAGYGGTGLTSYAVGDIIYASSTSALSALAAAASGNVLLSGTAPSWGKVDLTSHITGNLPVSNLDSGTSASTTTFWRGDGSWANPIPQALDTTDDVTFNSVTVTAGFGCNGKSAQTSYTVNSAVTGTAGATYGSTEQAMINDLEALVNQLRAALVANGIAV